MTTRRKLLLGAAATAVVGGGVGALAYRRYRPLALRAQPADSLVRDYRVSASPANQSDFVVARDDDPAAAVEKALAAMGGMARFIAKGDVVVIKPNVGWAKTPLQAANTNPDVVGFLVRAARAAGAKRVVVTDRPVDNAQESFERSGIGKAASDAGADVVIAGEDSFRETPVRGRLIDTWPLLSPVLDATKVINVPIAKHHGSAKFTGALKNWFGLAGGERFRLHLHLNEAIADLALFLRPTLTLLDATRVLLRNGPRGGNLADTKELKTVIAAIDPVACDAYGCTLLGMKPDDLPYLRMAEEQGLGTREWTKLRYKEV